MRLPAPQIISLLKQARDVYSLDVVLPETLAGEHLFSDLASVEHLYKHENDPLPICQMVFVHRQMK